jgi:hypothetical protein
MSLSGWNLSNLILSVCTILPSRPLSPQVEAVNTSEQSHLNLPSAQNDFLPLPSPSCRSSSTHHASHPSARRLSLQALPPDSLQASNNRRTPPVPRTLAFSPWYTHSCVPFLTPTSCSLTKPQSITQFRTTSQCPSTSPPSSPLLSLNPPSSPQYRRTTHVGYPPPLDFPLLSHDSLDPRSFRHDVYTPVRPLPPSLPSSR